MLVADAVPQRGSLQIEAAFAGDYFACAEARFHFHEVSRCLPELDGAAFEGRRVALDEDDRASVDLLHGRRVAETRAQALLREFLSEAERRHLAERGYLEVRSPMQPQRLYRIPKQPGTVVDYECGRPVMSLCVQPVSPLPSGDRILVHKLMIEGNEEHYLNVARRLTYR